MKMETPLHQLDEPTRPASEGAPMDAMGGRADGRTDGCAHSMDSRQGVQQRDLQVAFTLSAGQISMKSVPP